MDRLSETRKKTGELVKQAETVIKRAEQTAETSRELLLESKRVGPKPSGNPDHPRRVAGVKDSSTPASSIRERTRDV